MSEEKKKETGKKLFVAEKLREFRSEFRKIVWPDRPALIKHTITVIAISLIFGAIITVMDFMFGLVFTNFIQMVG